MGICLMTGYIRLRQVIHKISLVSLFSVIVGILLFILPAQGKTEYTMKDNTDRDNAYRLYLEKRMKSGPFPERDRQKIPGLEVEPEEVKEDLIKPAKPAVEEKKEEPSVIEKAYRLQYSDYILRQLAKIEHIDIPSIWLEKQHGTLEALDRLSVKIRDQLGSEETDISTILPKDFAFILKEKLEILETVDEPSARLRERLLILKERYLNLIEKYFIQFGYDLFRPEGFPPPTNMVLSEDYILGPGDVLRINIWGSEADFELDGIIKPDGTITLPRLGIIPLAGVRYGDVKKIITREAQKYIQGINLNVTILQPRSLGVYVVGQVKNPGFTVIPAFSTVLTALSKAGGPLKVGSLRNIMIYRKGKLYRRLDLYDIILKGDISNDVLIEDKDVVHVPYIGSTVAVIGAVRRPAIFEIKDESCRLDKTLAMAGRVMAQAQAKLNVRRFKNNRALTVLDVNLNDPKTSTFHTQDGDLVEVRYIAQKFPKTIKITGHLWDPLELAYHEGMRISEVVPRPEMIKPNAITNYALLRRYDPLTTEFREEKISLPDIWSGETDFPLKVHDEIKILAKEDYGIKTFVYLRGAVWKPGDFEYMPGMTLRDLIALGGGLKKWTGHGVVELTRQKIINNEVVTEHSKIDLFKDKIDKFLQPFDMVSIPQVKGAGSISEITITGEIRFPGVYALKKGERLSDLITRAGGFLPTAYLYGTRFYSKNAQKIQQQAFDKLISDLEMRITSATVGAAATATGTGAVQAAQAQQAAMTSFISGLKSFKTSGRVVIKLVDLESFKGSAYDIKLENEDSLEIPSIPAFVSVVGSVYAPNSYLYQPNATLADYLKLAGGPSKTADTMFLTLHKANGEIVGLPSMSSRSFYKQKLMPGDTIVVPEDMERVPRFRMVKDITDIMYKITLAVGVVATIL